MPMERWLHTLENSWTETSLSDAIQWNTQDIIQLEIGVFDDVSDVDDNQNKCQKIF